jgi:tetratricopeptide (TPR) repeat protein
MLATAATLIVVTRAPAEDDVKVRTTYAVPPTIDNPFIAGSAPPTPPTPPFGQASWAVSPQANSPPGIADIPNRYYSPPGISWRDPAVRWQRGPQVSSAQVAPSSGPPPFDPFETDSGVAIVSDLEEGAPVDDPADDPELDAAERGAPEIAFTDKTAGRPPEPAFETEADSSESCHAAAAKAARYADSLGEISSVIRLCRQGLQYETSREETASLRRLAAWAYNRRGEFHAAAGREAEATKDFQAAIRYDPQCASALHNRAITYAQHGQAEAALRDFDRALEANPGLAIAHRNRGELLASLGRTEEAVPDYGQAIVQWPNDAELYKMRGHAFHRLGDFEKATIDLTRAIELAPEQAADAYTLRGNVQAERGDFREALRDYQRALKADRTWAEAYRSKAWLLATCPDAKVRHPGRALVAARQAQKLTGPDDCYVLEALAAAYASNGKFDEAIRIQQRAVAQSPRGFADQPREHLALYRKRRPLVNRATPEVQPASHESTASSGSQSDDRRVR